MKDKKKLQLTAIAIIIVIVNILNLQRDIVITFFLYPLVLQIFMLCLKFPLENTSFKINTGTLSSSYDELLKAARSLKDGAYSTSLITTELGYHVIYRESSSEKPSYDDKKDEIQETLANEKISADATIRVTAMDELRKKYGMDILDEDIKKQYSNYIANQIASAKNNSNGNSNSNSK